MRVWEIYHESFGSVQLRVWEGYGESLGGI